MGLIARLSVGCFLLALTPFLVSACGGSTGDEICNRLAACSGQEIGYSHEATGGQLLCSDVWNSFVWGEACDRALASNPTCQEFEVEISEGGACYPYKGDCQVGTLNRCSEDVLTVCNEEAGQLQEVDCPAFCDMFDQAYLGCSCVDDECDCRCDSD